jgi:hypothetical protein
MNRHGANGAGGSLSQKWPVLIRVIWLVALGLVFVGFVIGGPVGGSVLLLGGLGVVLSGVVVLADVGGTGTEFAVIYQNSIQRRMPGAVPPQPSQRVGIARTIGTIWVALGLGYMAIAVMVFLGVIGLARP